MVNLVAIIVVGNTHEKCVLAEWDRREDMPQGGKERGGEMPSGRTNSSGQLWGATSTQDKYDTICQYMYYSDK